MADEIPTPEPPAGRTRGGVLVSIFGRTLVVVAGTLVGLVGGLIAGAVWGAFQVAALPPPPARMTMGMESAGFLPAIVFVIHLAMGAALGTLAGFVLSLIWMIVMPGPRPRAG